MTAFLHAHVFCLCAARWCVSTARCCVSKYSDVFFVGGHPAEWGAVSSISEALAILEGHRKKDKKATKEKKQKKDSKSKATKKEKHKKHKHKHK